MPSPVQILSGLEALTNHWRVVALGWHVALGLLLFGMTAGWRPSDRTLGRLLMLPILSVAVMAWYSSNPFNEVAFGLLALVVLGFGRGASTEPIRIASPVFFFSGVALTSFAWIYPHFLHVDRWIEYGYASPLGVIPCPTLSALIGVALMTGLFRSRVLSIALALAGLFYGVIGMYRLNVTMDVVLAAGALMFVVATIRRSEWRSVRATRDEKQRVLPGDEFIAFPYATVTHAITIRRPPRDVWPWLAQMGAGTRAGWYSYDSLDNGHKASATRIIPDLQRLETGMLFPALPGETSCFTLTGFERDRFLTLSWALTDLTPLTVWTFVLEEARHDSTRLIVRAHTDKRYHFPRVPDWLSNGLLPMANFIMQRKQLLNVAGRVESSEPSRKPTYNDRLMTDAA